MEQRAIPREASEDVIARHLPTQIAIEVMEQVIHILIGCHRSLDVADRRISGTHQRARLPRHDEDDAPVLGLWQDNSLLVNSQRSTLEDEVDSLARRDM